VTHFNWTPGIGDPTIGGWVTVVLYLLAAGSCWISAQKLGLGDVWSNERRAWRAISVLFLVLGINKQLDLQTALTEAGRVLAHYEGWYEQRRVVQLTFIALVAIICLIAAITLLLWTRRAPSPTRLALIGTTIVLGFVLIRAASFHRVDQFIGKRILGLRWNWVAWRPSSHPSIESEGARRIQSLTALSPIPSARLPWGTWGYTLTSRFDGSKSASPTLGSGAAVTAGGPEPAVCCRW
jgi:hypothetical protein